MRDRYPLELEQVLQLTRCPDWPRERVLAYASTRTSWVAADVAEDGLAGAITVGDAVWFLLQPGILPRDELTPFVIACANQAVSYIALSIFSIEHVPDGTHRTADEWRAAELTLRAIAVSYSKEKCEAEAQRLMHCSRCTGLAASWLDGSSTAFALRASKLALQCCVGDPQLELRRQLQHLHALVA